MTKTRLLWVKEVNKFKKGSEDIGGKTWGGYGLELIQSYISSGKESGFYSKYLDNGS